MNGNPYEILGVTPDASDEEIKQKHRELAKKYHPDRYSNDPLADLAEEKFKEINEAYDIIMQQRKNGQFGSNSSYYNSANRYTSPEYNEIRRNIDLNNLKQAQDLLDNIPDKNNAEWFFLSGMISYKRGWYDDALGKIQQAVAMDPSNQEYQQAMNILLNSSAGYQNQAQMRGYNSSGNDACCQACQCACCLDLCCC